MELGKMAVSAMHAASRFLLRGREQEPYKYIAPQYSGVPWQSGDPCPWDMPRFSLDPELEASTLDPMEINAGNKNFITAKPVVPFEIKGVRQKGKWICDELVVEKRELFIDVIHHGTQNLESRLLKKIENFICKTTERNDRRLTRITVSFDRTPVIGLCLQMPDIQSFLMNTLAGSPRVERSIFVRFLHSEPLVKEIEFGASVTFKITGVEIYYDSQPLLIEQQRSIRS